MTKTAQKSAYSSENAAYLEQLYEHYLTQPDSVAPQWQNYFERLNQQSSPAFMTHSEHAATASVQENAAHGQKQIGVLNLIRAYRARGHRHAHLDPLTDAPSEDIAALSLAVHGLTAADYATEFAVFGAFGQKTMRLADLVARLKATYCHHIALETSHIEEQTESDWLYHYLETYAGKYPISAAQQHELLTQLIAADRFEQYLHQRYVGQKRFSLEGGDALIPLLNQLIMELAHNGAQQLCLAMAHRGRLNVLAHVLGKPAARIFAEFEGQTASAAPINGDVKYHLGFTARAQYQAQSVQLSLMYNPSHLEFVNAVALGFARAQLEHCSEKEGVTITAAADKVVPILIHGDAALSGQGINQEVLQLSQLRGYFCGGAVHIVVNNQIGFTTTKTDARSSLYCTDIAKSIQAPVIHVNGDDPEAVFFVAQLAAAYRLRFHKDIFVDLVCYRRLGHNEADEPAITNPKMYDLIQRHETPARIYANQLIAAGRLQEHDYQALIADYMQRLKRGDVLARAQEIETQNAETSAIEEPLETGVARAQLQQLGARLFAPPEVLNIHPIVARLLTHRQQMVDGHQDLDWGCAEHLAYASLLAEGYSLRLSGEDSGRGTFSHRQAVIHDQKNETTYCALQHIAPNQRRAQIIDSLLSEAATLGFEYGYACAEPQGLVIWEGQFGDFANGAQVIIDQFVSSGASKWGQDCGLTLFLPHGFEGQGPEHSSARLERYLQLCAQHNMRVCNPTTPAQIFHLLRQQLHQRARRPLIVMTPKSLLRHKLATSPITALTAGTFVNVFDDAAIENPEKVRRVILCSGKIYYDLWQKRREQGDEHTIALIRLEQLYPFPADALALILKNYSAAELIWCQEEPRNQGAWRYLYECWHDLSERSIRYIGRAASASTAVGDAKRHLAEQNTFITQALTCA